MSCLPTSTCIREELANKAANGFFESNSFTIRMETRAERKDVSLNLGESLMPFAPRVQLANGELCVPQQYLQYEQSVESVSAILSDIECLTDILLFCGFDEFGLYLQVGSIGPDNYKKSRAHRLVYGRKWRIDTFTPTSEVIQTAFLAIKKAYEHEVRELVSINSDTLNAAGTPFTTHIDLPLMANYPELVSSNRNSTNEKNEEWLQEVRFDGRSIRVANLIQSANGNFVVDLQFSPTQNPRAHSGFDSLKLTLVLQELNERVLLHELMNALIKHSDRVIDEQFTYRGFARFSQRLNPFDVANLSIVTRNANARTHQFEALRKQINYNIDKRRAPFIGAGDLAVKNRHLITQEGALGGHMPYEQDTHSARTSLNN